MKSEQEDLRGWVAGQTALLEPPGGWEPDAAAALVRFRGRVLRGRSRPMWRRWLVLGVAAAGLVTAQQFWQYLTVRQVAFIQVKAWPEGVPSPVVGLIGIPIPPLPAHDLEEAGRRVHYTARVPDPFVFSQGPKFSTTFSLSAGTTVKVAELELALEKAGVTGQAVPPQWDGAQVALHTSGVVIAEWPDVVLAQSLPLTLTAPATFDFAAYSALILRILGVSPGEAQRLAQEMGTTPPWLAPIPGMRSMASIEQVTLNSGPATLVRDGRDEPWSQITLCWSVPDRVYLLHGHMSKELAITAANAVH